MDRTRCEFIRKVRDEFQQSDVYFCDKPKEKRCIYDVHNYTESYCLHPNREKISEARDSQKVI